jgi:polyhydroxyalkanoate synthesis repressor PhaR
VAEDTKEPKPDVVIKKYANRRLYNTATSTYVTLDDLASMVKSGTNFVVYDAKSGDDITRSVLTQIIVEEESKGQNMLPINFLRQLIGLYGHSMQNFVPSYLEFSLDALVREQEKLGKQLAETFGANTVPGAGRASQAQRRAVPAGHEDVQPVRRSRCGAGRTPGAREDRARKPSAAGPASSTTNSRPCATRSRPSSASSTSWRSRKRRTDTNGPYY